MERKIKLSIIIPMYNAESYIENCLNSLINQDIKKEEYEIIVVDDGGLDNSANIVKNYKKIYNNINLISVANGGQSYARNIGIDNATGEYLYFVDSDDYISQNSIGSIIDTALKNDLEMIFFDLKRVDNENYINCEYKIIDEFSITRGIDYFTVNNVNNGPCHYFISKEFIKNNNLKFSEGKFCEDGMFLIDCIFKAQRVSYCKIDVYRYVIRENSTTTKKDKKHLLKVIEDFMYTIEYMNNYYLEAIEKEYSEAFINRLLSRRNSYIYFMQIRMIKSRVGFSFASTILKRLKELGCYKYKRMSRLEYNGLKTTIIWRILNCKFIFCSLC